MGREHLLSLSPGKLVGLSQVTDASFRFKVLALDQSNSFKKSLRAMHARQGEPKEPDYAEIRDAKLEIASVLAPQASAVLLDVNFGALQAVAGCALPRGVGLLVRLEASRDAGLPGEVEPGWSVAKIKRMGASAVKLLVYTDVEDARAMDAQMRFVEETRAACEESDILLLVEELSYPRASEDKKSEAYVARRPRNIVESAKRIGPSCDVLKLEYPGEGNLAALNEAAIRPWVLLSAGEKFDVFVSQVESAMKAGASGIMAGRAIFNEYFEQPTAKERRRFLETTGRERMAILTALVDRLATPAFARYGISPAELAARVRPDWYALGADRAARPEASGEY